MSVSHIKVFVPILAILSSSKIVCTADGVIGQAEGLENGDTFYWNYTIDLPVPDGTMRVTFDDYMWLISEERMLNKAYMSKFGMPLGEVTIMFEKL